LLGSKPPTKLSAVKKLVKGSKNSAFASSAPVKATACWLQLFFYDVSISSNLHPFILYDCP
jgi:hypothetical protein